jgi:hypothetical protein
VDYSLGRANLIKGGIDYVVRFQADVCMPHPGQVFRAPVTLRSKIGLHAEISPLKILIPRDLHIGNGEFDETEEKQEIEFEVTGSRFQQGDESIVVLGKLRTVVRPAEEEPVESNETSEPLLAAPVSGMGTDSEKRVVTVNVASTKAAEQGPRRRRLNQTQEKKTNE